MPLRDHFHPPVSKRSSPEAVYGGWPMVMVQHLRKILPSPYKAAPRVHLGSQVEVDIAAFEREDRGSVVSHSVRNLTTAWAPAEPTLAVETELADFDEYEVRIYDAARERRLVAAIEIISPANKDRPESRSQFVAKCVALLRQDVSVAMVDLVTSRDFNLYAELLEWINQHDTAFPDQPPPIYAVACRSQPRGATSHFLQAWSQELKIGRPLPVLPLWLRDDLVIPLDLEVSYEQTCSDLDIA
jgi:hypothetical protein